MRKFIPLAFLGSLLASAAAQVDSIVVFNEIHYNPSTAGEQAEFIELFNQNSVNVELSDWRIEGVGSYTFPKGTIIQGRSYLVVAKDPVGLRTKTGLAEVLGPYSANLSNDGERLILRNHNGRVMDELRFGDSYPWPTTPDGSGATLSKIRPYSESGPPERWAGSRAKDGTPGMANDTQAPIPSLSISEIPAASAKLEDAWVEIHNHGTEPIGLQGIKLQGGAGQSYELKTGTLAPDAYLLIQAKDLGFPIAVSDRLFAIDALGKVLDGVIWQNNARARLAQEPTARFYVPAKATPGAANDIILQTSLVVNEIMYHHRPNYREDDVAGSTYTENPEEWIEITNRGNAPIDLSGWRIRGGISYDFSKGLSILPGAYVVISNDAEALRKKHTAITIVGNFQGQLRNKDDLIELQDPSGNLADSVHYYDDVPWPNNADGGGSSLELRNPQMDNSVPEAWKSSDESKKSEWRKYTYRAKAIRPTYTATVGSFHEIRLGLLEAGQCLIDNVSVIEDPSGAKTELMKNPSFSSTSTGASPVGWRMIGNHGTSKIVSDEQGNSYLQMEASSPTNYLNNLCEGDLTKVATVGGEYELSFDAKWISGSPQFRSEIYYNKIAKLSLLKLPEKHGTPGAKNTAFEDNPGPTFTGLNHTPGVPDITEDVTVSISASDPDGLSAVALFYNVGETAWNNIAMNRANGRYTATIPKQDNNKIVQFYVAGIDGKGGSSVYPADGEKSGAFVRFSSAKASGNLKQPMRLITRASDAAALNKGIDILSNARKPCTVIMDETDVTYECGIRLRGSMFSRNGGADSGVNIKFPADQPFRGTQGTITVRRRNPVEIVVKHMANQAGGVPESYNDFVELRGYMNGQTGLARLEMTRFGPGYWDGLYRDGSSSPCFKMEGIRDFQSRGTGGVKNPQPVGWIVAFDFANLGEDKEQYRHVIRNTQALAADDYEALIRMCKAFSAPNEKLREEIEKVIDVDQWARVMAVQTLCGIADVYPIENPHNFIIYPRPTDGLFINCPWDWDFVFSLSAAAKIYDPQNSRKNLWRVFRLPGVSRLYEGHLLDLMDTIFTREYVTPWFTSYGRVGATAYTSQISTLVSRATSVRKQIRPQIPFMVSTNEGADFSVDTAKATLRGEGWINIRKIRWVEKGMEFTPRWIDDKIWELTLPLAQGANTITLQALDYRGSAGSDSSPVGRDSIVVTNTGSSEAPSSKSLVISEVMYHPAAPSAQEIAAGFTDQDMFEFIELANRGSKQLDLSDLGFSRGIITNSTATTLAPGQVVLYVANKAAFEKRYGQGIPIAGTYQGNLSNGGEEIVLTGLNGLALQTLSYRDQDPWPVKADGGGYSLVPKSVLTITDQSIAALWRISEQPGGSPGKLEAPEALPTNKSYESWLAERFSDSERGNQAISGLGADPDGDKYSNFAEYAFGRDPKIYDHGPLVSYKNSSMIYRKRVDAVNLEFVVESSSDLNNWKTENLSESVEDNAKGYQSATVLLNSNNQSRSQYFRVRATLKP